MAEARTVITSDYSLGKILSNLLSAIFQEQSSVEGSRLLDELICNIQQHAQTDAGYAFANYNSASDSIEIVIGDGGVSIYGSYVAAQKHLDILGDSDAQVER